MNLSEAEAIAALAKELEQGVRLSHLIQESADVFDAGEADVLQLAAERVIERIFQATLATQSALQNKYFPGEALTQLRGMRNRLAHNYLGTDPALLRRTLAVDLPQAQSHMHLDLSEANALLSQAVESLDPQSGWSQTHLGEI